MTKRKINVTFQEDDDAPLINGRTTSRKSGNNAGRSIYVTDDGKFIIKVDDRGYTHDDEGVYKRIERKDRRFFVPVLAQGYNEDGNRWSIQPYVDLSWDKTEDDETLVDELENKYELSDIHEENWAVYKGSPVIFDYGLEWNNK